MKMMIFRDMFTLMNQCVEMKESIVTLPIRSRMAEFTENIRFSRDDAIKHSQKTHDPTTDQIYSNSLNTDLENINDWNEQALQFPTERVTMSSNYYVPYSTKSKNRFKSYMENYNKTPKLLNATYRKSGRKVEKDSNYDSSDNRFSKGPTQNRVKSAHSNIKPRIKQNINDILGRSILISSQKFSKSKIKTERDDRKSYRMAIISF